jgi:RNA methyltransferase, TrmH family
MGSLFARPPARADDPARLPGTLLPLDAQAVPTLRDARLEPPLVLCLGAERAGLPAALTAAAVRIPVATDSLNVAMAATVALYEVANRMAAHA